MVSRSRSRSVFMTMVASCAAIMFLGSADPAFAKILPVISIAVETTRPTVGHRVEVVVHFASNFELGDFEWENHEVSVVPVGKVDSGGWPVDLTDPGTPVPLRRISKGLFRGTFVMRRPGDYVVFAWSSVHAREDRLLGVVTKGHYAAPVRLRIARAAVPRSSSTSPAPWVAAIVLAIGLVAMAASRRVTRRDRIGAGGDLPLPS